jgi:hypothetical protein
VQYLGIDWGYRRAAFCGLSENGAISAEGFVPADEDGLARLVLDHATEVKACVEMMSGAVWVRDQLAAAGWRVQIAHARKVRDVAPLACKTRQGRRARVGRAVSARPGLRAPGAVA